MEFMEILQKSRLWGVKVGYKELRAYRFWGLGGAVKGLGVYGLGWWVREA